MDILLYDIRTVRDRSPTRDLIGLKERLGPARSSILAKGEVVNERFQFSGLREVRSQPLFVNVNYKSTSGPSRLIRDTSIAPSETCDVQSM